MSIFDEVAGGYYTTRLEDLPKPPKSIWRSAQEGLSSFMDSALGGLAEVPLTVVTAPQRAVEAGIGAIRGGFELSPEELKAYGEEAYDRDAAVPLYGGGESIADTAYRRLRGRGYTVPGGGQIFREAAAGAGELLGIDSAAPVMGLSRDPSQAGGYRPISETEQQQFETESPILSRVAAPVRVGTELAGSFATDPTAALAFGPKIAAAGASKLGAEAAQSALKAAALETARAERLAARAFVPGAIVGATGATLEAGRAVDEEGITSPRALEALLGAGVATGLGGLAGRTAFSDLPKPPTGLPSFKVEETPKPPQVDVDRYAYRARDVGEQGIPSAGHAQASMSEQDVRRLAPSRTDNPQEVVRVDLQKLDPTKYEITPTPSGERWVRLKEGLPEEAVERVGELTELDRAAASKAELLPEPQAQAIRSTVDLTLQGDIPTQEAIAAKTGLSPEQIQKGAEDTKRDATYEFSPEAVAFKRASLDAAPKAEGVPYEPFEARQAVDTPEQVPSVPVQPEPVSMERGQAPPLDGELAFATQQLPATEQPIEAPKPTFGLDNVRKAFPTGKVAEIEGAWEIKLPGNRNVRVTPVGDVEFSVGDLRRGHPEAVDAQGLKPGQKVVGSWQRIGRGGLISLAKEAGQATLDHEAFHGAMELVLSEREKKAVLKRYGNEEAAADAYGAWNPKDRSNGVFSKIAQFFQKIYRSLFPNAESVFGKVRTGEAFDRTGTKFEEKPLPPRVPPPVEQAPIRNEPGVSSGKPENLNYPGSNDGSLNYQEFLDSSLDEVPTATVKPKPEFPPVTGRRVLPDETPRVENRVDDLAAATADADIPEMPLDRDTVQSWKSLDPKVKKILRTYDEQSFYDTMRTRNLDAAETQAFDAVIKGKEQRLEKLKAQERTPERDQEIAAQTLDYIAAQRAYINDGTGLARALAARARVMSAGNPAEAFARKVESFKIPKAKAANIVQAFKRDPGLLEMIRKELAHKKLSVVEDSVPRFATEAVDPLMQRMLDAGLSEAEATSFLDNLRKDPSVLPELEAAVSGPEPSEVLLKKVFKELPGVSDKQAAEIIKAFEENPDNLAPLLHAAIGSGKLKKVLEFWRAGLLSSFSTDVANISGNLAEHHIRLAETGVASGVDWLLQKVYGGDRARFAGEVGAEMAGANMALGPAIKGLVSNLKDVVTLKDKPIDLNRRLEHQVGAIGGTTGKVVRAIGFGKLEVMDAFFKEWGGSAEAMKLAYRKASNELPAGSSKSEIRSRAKEIVSELMDPENDTHSDLLTQVEKAKTDRTFQEKRPGSLTEALSGVVRRNPLLSFVAPFVQTPGNIANAIIKRSPLGAKKALQAYGEFRQASAAFDAGKIDQKAFSEARGKFADAIASPLLGTALLAGFSLYANAGGMTGSGPTDEKAKNALRDSGWSPYSFVLTDPRSGKKVYVPFNRFEPISSLLGFAADMAEAKNIKNLSLFDKALGSVVENLTSKSYLTGLSDAASLISKPNQFAPQYIKNLAGSFVPNIIGRTAAATDPYYRDTKSAKGGFAGLPESIGKTIISRIPFASQTLAPRVGSTGRSVERPGNALTRFASPVQPTIEKSERFLEREFGRLGWAPSSPSRKARVKDVELTLTDDEFRVLEKASMKAADEARNLVRSATYKSMPDDQREYALDRIFAKYRARGRQQIRSKLERRARLEARA